MNLVEIIARPAPVNGVALPYIIAEAGVNHEGSMDIARRLEDNNLLTNYQALPDDATFLDSSGIRMGVQEMTRFGMKEKDFEVLAGLIAEVIIRNKKVGEEVSRYRRNFLEMCYCLPEKQALELAGRLLLSLLPSPALAAGLAENMARRARELSA